MGFLENSQIIIQLVLAALLGSIIGLEREIKRKQAGIQTYSLVTIGSCLFTILSFEFFYTFSDQLGVSFDPSRIIQAVAIGIGFLGAGVIIFKQTHLEGLTTAAGLWVTAAIGIAVGVQYYFLAIFTTVLVITILFVLGGVERKIFEKSKKKL